MTDIWFNDGAYRFWTIDDPAIMGNRITFRSPAGDHDPIMRRPKSDKYGPLAALMLGNISARPATDREIERWLTDHELHTPINYPAPRFRFVQTSYGPCAAEWTMDNITQEKINEFAHLYADCVRKIKWFDADHGRLPPTEPHAA